MPPSPANETPSNKPPNRRAVRRADTVAEIKAVARQQLAESGTGGVSLRGIAREMGISPAALFRYFDGQNALITVLCVDAYAALADAITAGKDVAPAAPAEQWRATCHSTRRWARDNPGEFALLNGTPIPGYHPAPEETGPAAAQVMVAVGSAYLAAVVAGDADPEATGMPPLAAGPLLTSLAGTDALPASPITGIVANAWSSILGFLAGEIFGSLGELVSDTDTLFDCHVETVMRGMGFRS